MSANFKTCFFGGFDREDVIAYIEKTAKNNQEEASRLRTQIDELQQQNDDLSQQATLLRRQVEHLSSELQGYEETRRVLESAQTDKEALTGELAALRAESDGLRQQAGEYLKMRDHIAEIEISAHRRTEEFRAAAVQELRELIVRQQNWCEENRSRYQELNHQFIEKLHTAQTVLEGADLSTFDDLAAQLQELNDRLEQP